jgi:hypothetical protein
MRFWGNSSISAWYSQVKDDQFDKPSEASHILVDLKNDRYFFAAGQHRVDKDFHPSLGFVQRNDMVENRFIMGFTPRVGNGEELIRQMRYNLEVRDVKNLEGLSETSIVKGGIDAIFESRDRVGLKIIRQKETLLDGFTLVNGLEILKGDYQDRKISLSARTNQSRGYWGNFSISKGD